MRSWVIWRRTRLTDSMSTSMLVSDQHLFVNSFTARATYTCSVADPDIEQREGEGCGFVLLTLSAFLPSVISSFS